jgi:hypothetical protein
MYTRPTGEQVPVVNRCNTADPADPNYGYTCEVVFSYGGKNYFRHFPLTMAAGSYYANYGCVGL